RRRPALLRRRGAHRSELHAGARQEPRGVASVGRHAGERRVRRIRVARHERRRGGQCRDSRNGERRLARQCGRRCGGRSEPLARGRRHGRRDLDRRTAAARSVSGHRRRQSRREDGHRDDHHPSSRASGAPLMHARALVAVAAYAALSVGTGATGHAQWVFEPGGRLAPQFHSYTIGTPSNTKITELAIPIYAFVPITQALSVDVGAACAAAHVEQTTTGQTVRSDVSGLTDSQVRANYVMGTDFVVLTAGINLPSGHSAVTQSQQLAAGLIGSDFLAFPISNMGTGFGGTGGVAIARPLGDWNAGFAVSMRRSSSYAPFDDAGVRDLRYQPGDEYRARAGIDRAVGTGRVTLGITYSRFGNDELAGSIYNTGDRYLTTFSLDNTVGAGH